MLRLSFLSLCLALTATTVRSEKITYDDHIHELFRSNCRKCHNPEKEKGDLNLMSYAGLMKGSGSGAIVIPGDPDGSVLLQVLTHESEPEMPPKASKRPLEELELIRQWIAGGILETSSSKAKKAPKQTLALNMTVSTKPTGAPAIPEHHLLEPHIIPARPNAITAIAHSPWAPVLAIGTPEQILLYHSSLHTLLGVLAYPEGNANALRFSRNGELLLAGGGRGGDSGNAVVWNVKTGERLFSAGDEMDAVMAADISSDHSLIGLGSSSKLVRVFETSTGNRKHQIRKHTEWVSAMAFSPDSVLLATGDRNGGLYVWESFSGQRLYTLRGHQAKITAVTWRPDSNILASSSEDGTIKLWNMHTGKQTKSFTAHKAGVLSLAFSPKSASLVSVGRDKQLKIWDPAGKNKTTIKDFTDLPLSAVFTHDEKHIIAGDWSGQIRQWKISGGDPISHYLSTPPSIQTRLVQTSQTVATTRTTLEKVEREVAAAEWALKETRAALATRTSQLEASQNLLSKSTSDETKARNEGIALGRSRKAIEANSRRSKSALQRLEKRLKGVTIAEKTARNTARDHQRELDKMTKLKTLGNLDSIKGDPQYLKPGDAHTPEDLQQARVRTLNRTLHKLRGTATSSSNRLVRATKDVTSLTTSITTAREKDEAIRSTLDKNSAAIVAAKKNAATQKTLSTDTQTAITTQKKQLQNETENVADAKKRLAAAHKRLSTSKRDLNTTQYRLALWTAAEANTHAHKARAELKTLQANYQQLSSEIEEAKLRQSELSESIKNAKKSKDSPPSGTPTIKKLKADLRSVTAETKASEPNLIDLLTIMERKSKEAASLKEKYLKMIPKETTSD